MSIGRIVEVLRARQLSCLPATGGGGGDSQFGAGFIRRVVSCLKFSLQAALGLEASVGRCWSLEPGELGSWGAEELRAACDTMRSGITMLTGDNAAWL